MYASKSSIVWWSKETSDLGYPCCLQKLKLKKNVEEALIECPLKEYML